MSFLSMILEILEIKMESPTPYGWFHLLMCGITIAWILDLCLLHKNDSETKIRKTVFITGIVVFILEIYKQIVYTFSVENGVIHTNFQWYAFPWQFCSIPMYVGMLTGLFRKGKIHQSLCAFLATYGIFAGCAVMLYPVSIYIDLIGINIQTSVCHGSMIVIGAYLLATGYVKLEGKTLLKALPVFLAAVGIAIVLNEIAYAWILPEGQVFNMFFISPHMEPELPVYSMVQEMVPYPWCLFLYIMGFTGAAGIILLAAAGIRVLACRLAKKTVHTH